MCSVVVACLSLRAASEHRNKMIFFSNKIVLSPQPKLSELVLPLKMDLQVQEGRSKVQHDCYRGNSQRGVNESGKLSLLRWSRCVLGCREVPWLRSSGSPWCPSTAAPGRAVTSQGWLFAGTAEIPSTQALTPDSDHARSPLDPGTLASGS